MPVERLHDVNAGQLGCPACRAGFRNRPHNADDDLDRLAILWKAMTTGKYPFILEFPVRPPGSGGTTNP